MNLILDLCECIGLAAYIEIMKISKQGRFIFKFINKCVQRKVRLKLLKDM